MGYDVQMTVSVESTVPCDTDTTSNLIDQLAEANALGTNGKVLLAIAIDAVTSLDENTSAIIVDRLYDKLKEFKHEQKGINQ